MSYRVTADLLGVRELNAALAKATTVVNRQLRELVAFGAFSIGSKAKFYAPVRYGQLRASIHTEGPTGSGAAVQSKVGTDVKHAKWQEFGTGLYGPRRAPITPKSKPFLVFKTKDGRWIRTKSVKGTRGRFYFKKAINQTMPQWRDKQREVLSHIFATLKS